MVKADSLLFQTAGQSVGRYLLLRDVQVLQRFLKCIDLLCRLRTKFLEERVLLLLHTGDIVLVLRYFGQYLVGVISVAVLSELCSPVGRRLRRLHDDVPGTHKI